MLWVGCLAGGAAAAAATALKSWDSERGSCTAGDASASSPLRPGGLLQRRWISCKESQSATSTAQLSSTMQRMLVNANLWPHGRLQAEVTCTTCPVEAMLSATPPTSSSMSCGSCGPAGTTSEDADMFAAASLFETAALCS